MEAVICHRWRLAGESALDAFITGVIGSHLGGM
jgi:hypothetical protein